MTTEPVILGFTGTRKGMTKLQLRFVRNRITGHNGKITRSHHGSCIGSDEEFHDICLLAGIPVEVWPGNVEKLRAPCLKADLYHEPMDLVERDRKIVDACSVLMAAPRGYKEELRSGTWLTVRYALKQGKLVFVVWPSGEYQPWKGEAK